MDVDEPNDVSLGELGWVRYKDSVRGISLCNYFWPVAEARAICLCIHGHGAYVGFDFLKNKEPGATACYKESFIEHANREHYSVCGIDFQGHGRSDSLKNTRCYVERFQDYVDDLLDFAKSVKEDKNLKNFYGLPIFLIGASLGGCIAVNAMHQKGDYFRGALLLAPMLSLETVSKTGLNPYLRPLASLLSALTPTLCLAELKKNRKFPELQIIYNTDPLTFHHKTRARVAVEYLHATEKTMEFLYETTFPFIVFHSKNDDMTDYEGSAKLMKLSKSEDKTLIDVSEMWHFLLKEPGHEKVEKEMFAWVQERCR